MIQLVYIIFLVKWFFKLLILRILSIFTVKILELNTDIHIHRLISGLIGT